MNRAGDQIDILPLSSLQSSALAPARWSPIQARLAALAVTVAVYVILFGLVAAAELHFSRWWSAFIHARPLALLGVALLLAQCSLIAIGWARSRWPAHMKTLLAAAGWFCTWALLIALLPVTNARSAAGESWAICLAAQIALLAILLALPRGGALWLAGRRPGTFSLLTLTLWTTLIAVLLGAGRALATRLEWSSEIVRWEDFWKICAQGAVNALLGIAVALVVALPWNPWKKLAAALLLVGLIAAAAPPLMGCLFAKLGASHVELAWLVGTQGIFLLAALLPLEMSRTNASSSC